MRCSIIEQNNYILPYRFISDMPNTTTNKTLVKILCLVIAVSVVQGHIIMQCPQIANIKINRQGQMNGAQTIHIKRQPVSINLLSQQSQYNNKNECDPVRQQLDILKTKSLTIGGHNGKGQNQAKQQNIASMAAQAQHHINERSQNSRTYIDSQNQNVENNMRQQLKNHQGNAEQKVNRLHNQQKAAQNQCQDIVINIGAYNNPQQHQNQQTISQSTTQAASAPVQTTPTQQSTQNSQNIQVSDDQWQAVRSSFIQTHRDRVNNIISNSSSQNQSSQNQQSQESTPVQTTQSQAVTVTPPSESRPVLQAKIRSTIYEGPDSLRRRIDNLEADMLARQKRQMMKRLNEHYVMVGANQDIFANFRVPSFSGSPSYTSTHCGPMRPMGGCACSMGWPM